MTSVPHFVIFLIVPYIPHHHAQNTPIFGPVDMPLYNAPVDGFIVGGLGLLVCLILVLGLIKVLGSD